MSKKIVLSGRATVDFKKVIILPDDEVKDFFRAGYDNAAFQIDMEDLNDIDEVNIESITLNGKEVDFDDFEEDEDEKTS